MFAPLVVGLGVLVGRVVAGRWRAPVQAVLIVSGVLALFAYPLVRGFGRAAHNPTSLPRDYGSNLVVVVAFVALAVAAGALLAAVAGQTGDRRRRRALSPPA